MSVVFRYREDQEGRGVDNLAEESPKWRGLFLYSNVSTMDPIVSCRSI